MCAGRTLHGFADKNLQSLAAVHWGSTYVVHGNWHDSSVFTSQSHTRGAWVPGCSPHCSIIDISSMDVPGAWAAIILDLVRFSEK